MCGRTWCDPRTFWQLSWSYCGGRDLSTDPWELCLSFPLFANVHFPRKCYFWNRQHCETLFNRLQYSWGISDWTLSVNAEHNPHWVKPAKSVTDLDLFNLILAVQYFQRTCSNLFDFSRIKAVYSAKPRMASSMERLFSVTRRTRSYKNDPPSILAQSRTCLAYLGAMVIPLPNGNANWPQLTTWTLPSPNVSRPIFQIIRLPGAITLSRIN
jgi:hypothetical protein